MSVGADLTRFQEGRPTPAGMYDAFLGGRHHTPAEAEAAAKVKAVLPEAYDAAWANRGFLQRAVRFLADQGIRQFVDLGAGLPARNATHQVVAGLNARVVYVDVDPRVRDRSLKLLADTPGATAITADLREVDDVLGQVSAFVDLSEPVGLLMVAVLHFVSDAADPYRITRRYMNALAPGSYLALSHATAEHQPEAPLTAIADTYKNATEQVYMRTKPQVERFFVGLDLVRPHPSMPPAVTYAGYWGADDPAEADSDGARWIYCGVARRP